MENKPEVKIVRHYWGLTWPTLIVGAITVLAMGYMVYHIYISALAVAVSGD